MGRGRPKGSFKNLKNLQVVENNEVITELTEHSNIELLTKFTTKEEKKLCKLLLNKYLNEFEIESISDRNSLAQLIYFEVTQVRIQESLNEIYSKNAKAVSQDLLETMHKNAEIIIKLKNTLGLAKSKEKVGSYDALQHLIKRHEKWQEENQASRVSKCPHCLQLIWWKISTEGWEQQKHPFFKDTFLYNKTLIDSLGKTITISKEFISQVFETSTDYIDWVINRISGKRIEHNTNLELTEKDLSVNPNTSNISKESTNENNQNEEGDQSGQEEAIRQEEGQVKEINENKNEL